MESEKSSCGCGAQGKNRIIYCRSGIGSNVGQLANGAACHLSPDGYGGSCLAGIGRSIGKLIDAGREADGRVVIDDCPVGGAKKFFEDNGIVIDRYLRMTDLSIDKTPGPAYSMNDVQTVVNVVRKG